MNFDEAVELALRTWYPKDHPLHFNPHHPLGKLLGEWGELLDDYMKFLYKPNYVFKPQDELGDIWYYLRILAYQNNHKLNDLGYNVKIKTDIAIALVMVGVANILIEGLNRNTTMDIVYTTLIGIAGRYNLTLDDLTRSNWEKLKPGSERGEQWMEARVLTNYVGGKIGGSA